MVELSIAPVIARFPAFQAAVLVCRDITITAERPAELAAGIARREAEARAKWAGKDLAQIPGIAVWREAYKGFGIKKTSYRCSVERIVKNILAEREVPRINTFVDCYNAVSLSHVLCLGADDLDACEGPFAFRFAKADDSFIDMAAQEGEDPHDPPKEGEVVFADAKRVLCRRWNWRQDARSIISPATRNALLTVQGNGHGDVMAAAEDAKALIEHYCGGRVEIGLAEKGRETLRFSARS